MMFITGLLTLVVAVGWSNAACPPGIAPGHTLCLADVGTPMEVTAADKQAAIDRHNEIRSQVDVPAADMMQMSWDDDLAKTAAKWAAQCKFAHDTYEQRTEKKWPGTMVGQNMAMGYPTLVGGINGWYAEIGDFKLGVPTSKTIGHYTQEVYAGTSRVGCGIADCQGIPGVKFSHWVVCNYGPGQYGNPSAAKPYAQAARSCLSCPNFCENDLCDCKGRICLNGGKLNPNTCKCKCPDGYGGPTCEEKDCSNQFQSICDKYVAAYKDNKKFICQFGILKRKYCPVYCGFCP